MDLKLEVGILADVKSSDAEAYSYYKDQFRLINQALAAVGMSPHAEPESMSAEYLWSCEMERSSLHCLRRVAAYEAFSYDLPAPCKGESSRDPVAVDYYRETHATVLVRLRRLITGRRQEKLRFRHLMLHSDGEGYYLPTPFDDVIFPDRTLGVAGRTVGSSYALREECLELADLLDIPDDLDPQSEELLDEGESEGADGLRWRQYRFESRACVCLLAACEASIRAGAAIVFM